ncbi:hypothetical protein LLG90_22575 [Aromatoleum toluclasticum]|uniref:hypothetical protein n=1 Tax=Aromatoleum toluclasticum TaxID=92003 RepID=UPI001D1955AD|nr:hypothetical protein [Aromatoleum toluclasticum]MCC4118143.1 hypothetical protein [Aromatoleum toluclasticum]
MDDGSGASRLRTTGGARRRHPRLFLLWVGATVVAWAIAFAVTLRLINAVDFGPVGLPATVAIRFAVEWVLFTALAYIAIRSLPLGLKPGVRATTALGLWVALVVLSDCLSRLEFGVLDALLATLREAMGPIGVVLAMLAYILALALPFVPGVEIGLMIIMLFGAAGAVAAWAATIAGLGLAFWAGRLIPPGSVVRLLDRLGVAIPDVPLDAAMRRVVAGETSGRPRWVRVLARLLAHRYLTLGFALNLPGNSVLGGGGGIALLCGASRQFEWHWFVLTVAVATAPVPLLVLFGGLDVRDLVRLYDFVLEMIAGVGAGWW